MTQISMTANDILAGIALNAQGIVSAANTVAAGGPFPDPDAIAATLNRMAELNSALVALKAQAHFTADSAAFDAQPVNDEAA